MVFFTRKLYVGIQPKSGWERRAERDWHRRADIYAKYLEVISAMLPAPVRRLCKQGLHDGIVRQATLKGEALSRCRALAAPLAFVAGIVRIRPGSEFPLGHGHEVARQYTERCTPSLRR